jgi:hypothetical protein
LEPIGPRSWAEGPPAAAPTAPTLKVETDRQAALHSGAKALAAGQYAAAKAAYDSALRLGEQGPAAFGGRAAARIGLGDIDGGVADLKEAISRNAGDLGQKYKPGSSVTFSAAALKHGEQQVRRMLQDRPAMAAHVKPGDALWQWAVRKFAGEDLDDTLDWDAAAPRSGPIENRGPTDAGRRSIRISRSAADDGQDGPDASPEESWRRAALALHEVVRATQFRQAEDEAFDGDLTEREFIARVCALEHQAVQQTRAFYALVYLPWVRQSGAKTDPKAWDLLWWGRPAEAVGRYADEDAPTWRRLARRHSARQLTQQNLLRAIRLGETCLEQGAPAAVAAKAAFEAALRLEERETTANGWRHTSCYGFRAAARIGLGDFDGGIADLREAIQRNPGDVGQDYRPNSTEPLTAGALAHGEKQVRQMLADRPVMAQHVKPGEALWQWAVRKFAGEDLDDTIDWDPTPPRESSADHSVPGTWRRGSIRVSKYAAYDEQAGPAACFDALWSRAIFELHNITHRDEFTKVWNLALEGALTEDAFVARTCAIEHKALQETRAFYVQVYLPWAKSRGVTTRPAAWHILWWGRPDESIKRFSDRDSYPWRPYVRQYLRATLHRFSVQRNAPELIATAERYLKVARFPEEKADAHCYRAGAYLIQGDLERAREAIADCRKVAPKEYDLGYLQVLESQLRGSDLKVREDESKKRDILGPDAGWLDLIELYKDKA